MSQVRSVVVQQIGRISRKSNNWFIYNE